MPATIHRLRPEKSPRESESVQAAMDLLISAPGLTEGERAAVRHAAYLYDRHTAPEPPSWPFVMLNPDQVRYVLSAIEDTPKPATTHKVWIAALTHMRSGSGEIMASRERLARDARTRPDEVSRALNVLVRIGALTREQRGQRAAFFVNANVGWAGSEVKRRAAARKAPKLSIVE